MSHRFDSIDQANQAVIDAMMASQPILQDVVQAHEVIPELATDQRTLLHAGTPLSYAEMVPPMQASCVGAMLFEGWASDEADARQQLADGKIRLLPCHSVHAVGPMGGITSPQMAMLVVQNITDGNYGYCTMNEGIGKVLRFGAFDAEVVQRLAWMRDVLGPSLSAALHTTDSGYGLNPLMSRAITMGDEFHQRNIAASALFAKDMAPLLAQAGLPTSTIEEVSDFLGRTDQFFLNLAMAACKVMADAGHAVGEGTVVTALTRNGKDFGVRVAGLGDRWFTAAVNTPHGLYFTGYDESMACPDMGDSAITETCGLGGLAMIAAPGVTRFVGAGGFADALATSDELAEIVVGHNPAMSIPTWDFQGTSLGIDVRKVVATSITPLINTGIASIKPGVGQIGAGTVRAPLECFTQALEALAQEYGISAD